VIQSTGFGPFNATFFFRGGDNKMAELAFMEFPLDAALLAADERRRIERSQQAMQDRPVAGPTEVPSVSADPRERRGGLSRTVAWALLAFLILAAIFVGMRLFREKSAGIWSATKSPPAAVPASPPSSPHPSMGLHANRENGDLELTWNRESASIASATSGAISIQDGDALRIIPLDSAQVRGGSLLYAPLTGQIQMRLAVTTPTGVATESVLVILPKVGAPQTKPLVVPETQARPQSPPDNSAPPKATREFVAPSALAPSLSPAALPVDAPPVPKNNQDSAPAVVRLIPPVAPALPPPVREVAPAQATVPQAPTPQTATGSDSTYRPPVAVHEVAAAFPPELKSLVYKPRVVEIRVAIDKSGKVVKAEPVPQEGVHQFLINAAVRAAQLWKFQPARQGDQPVAGELVLQFVFKH
jgi:protein TonB